MSRYTYHNPDDAYQEALMRIHEAREKSSTTLRLNGLGLTTIPPELWNLTKLTRLELDNNKLKDVSSKIAKLTGLTELRLDKNQLEEVPPEITRLSELKVLDLDNNNLTSFPASILELINLTDLFLAGNQLKIVPPSIFQLSRLTMLDLGDNQLTTIPPEIGQLKKLASLRLWGNQLTIIPYEIIHLTDLQYLELGNNSGLTIPPEVLAKRQKAQSILDYLREQQVKDDRPLNEAKLILVGQGNVGKTSLVKRLLGKGFDETESQTEGIIIETWSLNVERPQQGTIPIALNIWDFGGQEIMHATHQFFLTKRSLYLIVLDARQGEYEGRVEYWLTLINSFAPGAPVLIIINKSDQHHLDINRRGLQEKYPTIKGVIRTSARNASGIGELKTEIASILATMEHIDSPFPARWMRIKKALRAMKAKHDYIPYAVYQELCQDNGVTDENSQTSLIHFLHDLGVVLSFDDDRIHDTNVLNPNWITQGIYTVLNSSALLKQHGILHHNQLAKLLPIASFPTAEQRRFVREMMLKFELAFELPDRQRMLIPDLISKEQPAFEWDDAAALQFAYQYTVLPHSILHRFMVRQHHRIDPVIRWHTGVMLHQDDFTALVKADIKAATIRISIAGEGDRRQFLYALRLEFASIHESISGTKPQEVVPIPGYPTAPPIRYSFLEQLEKKKVATIHHAAQDGEVIMLDVQQLLNGVSTSAMRQAGLPTRTQILADLRNGFNQDEFYGLLFELGINKNDVGGETVTEQMREFVAHMERHNRMAELVEAIGKKRPHLGL